MGWRWRGCAEDVDIARVHPELRALVRRVPPLPIGTPMGRWTLRRLSALTPNRRVDGVRIEQRSDVRPALRLYRPSERRSDAALLWLHGGGMVIGRASQDDRLCSETANALGVLVVSVEYRLAPEHPFPAPLDDAHTGWTWLQRNAETLGVDPARVAVGGQSAGGGLAAALAQRLHDEPGPEAAAQWLFCPMLDDRTAMRRELDAVNHFVWSNRNNAVGWRALLGSEPGGEVPRYAAAARREDLRGLPPAWIGVGDIELFFEENRAYAQRLRAAEVDVGLDVVPGAPHGLAAWAPDAEVTRAFVGRAQAWLEWTLAGPGGD
jgi:acetyl esterase/lipase